MLEFVIAYRLMKDNDSKGVPNNDIPTPKIPDHKISRPSIPTKMKIIPCHRCGQPPVWCSCLNCLNCIIENNCTQP